VLFVGHSAKPLPSAENTRQRKALGKIKTEKKPEKKQQKKIY